MDPELLAAIEALIRKVEAGENPTPEQLVTLRARLITAALTGDTATLQAAFNAGGMQMPTGGGGLATSLKAPFARFVGPPPAPAAPFIGPPAPPVPPPPKPPFTPYEGQEWRLLPDGSWDLWQKQGMKPDYDRKGNETGRIIPDLSQPPKRIANYPATPSSAVNAQDFSAAIQDKFLGAKMARERGDINRAVMLEKEGNDLIDAAGGDAAVGGGGPATARLKDLEYYYKIGALTKEQYETLRNEVLMGEAAGGGMSEYQAGQLDIARQRLGLDLTAEQRQRQETAIAAARSGEPLTYISRLRGGAAPTQGGTETYQGFPRLIPPAVEPESIGMVSPNAVTPTSASGGGAYSDLLAAAEQKYNLPAGILNLLMGEESSWINGRTSSEGAEGLLQLMPKTAEELGVTNSFDPAQSIDAGARYLRQMYDQFGNWSTALAAYNTGPDNVAQGKIPADTQAYVQRITAALERGDYMDNIQQQQHDRYGDPSLSPPAYNTGYGQAALGSMGATSATRTSALRAPASSRAPSITAAWQPPPAPGYMIDIQAGRAIKPAGILPGLTPPGVQAQANMTPYERAALRERVGFQGQSEMDWDALLEGIRRSMGPGLAAASYGGRLRAPA